MPKIFAGATHNLVAQDMPEPWRDQRGTSAVCVHICVHEKRALGCSFFSFKDSRGNLAAPLPLSASSPPPEILAEVFKLNNKGQTKEHTTSTDYAPPGSNVSCELEI